MFKKGNIVRFKCGFWGDIKSPGTGKLGVIEYSYGERYGNGEISGGYKVLDKETGASSAWWKNEYLEFVADGSEEEIKKCKEIAKRNKQKNENIDYIKEMILKDEDLGATYEYGQKVVVPDNPTKPDYIFMSKMNVCNIILHYLSLTESKCSIAVLTS